MASLPAFAGADMHGTAVRIKIGGSERCQFAVSRTRHEGGLSQGAEIRITGIVGLVDFTNLVSSVPVMRGIN